MRKFLQTVFVPDLETHIKRYPKRVRSRLRELSRNCGYTADLLRSFPAAAFALASDYGPGPERALALRLVKNGQPLRLVADALGLPYWLRKAPPEAFGKGMGRFPKDAQFHRQLSGTFPGDPDEMARWLVLVPQALRFSDQDFALWLAKQDIFSQDKDWSGIITMMAIYAWFSSEPQSYAGELIEHRWNKAMNYETLFHNVATWYGKIKVKLLFGMHGVTDPWLQPSRVRGYHFVPLLTPEELKEEGEKMNHCVADYTLNIARNNCRIFGIRQGGKHVATLEIQSHYEHTGRPAIEQLYGPDNEEVPARVWRATFAWLANQSDYNLPGYSPDPTPDTCIWKKLWQPYWEKKGKVPLLPEKPTENTLPEINKYLE